MKRIRKTDQGYSLYEILVVLLILGLTVVLTLPGALEGLVNFQEKDYDRECEMIYYQILQFQNDAMMDGCERRLRFLKDDLKCSWIKKDRELAQEIIAIKEVKFTGAYTDGKVLVLYPSGTVSRGGTLALRNRKNEDQFKSIIVQVGNGRIYLEE